MRRPLGLTLAALAVLLVLGFSTYRLWFHNPYEDELRIDPASLFGDDAATALLIRDTTVIDVAAGEAIPNAHVLIEGDTISRVLTGDEAPAAPPGARVYDGRGRFVMPGLFDTHVHLAMHWHLIGGDFGPRDALVTKAALEQFVRYGVTTVLAHGGGGGDDEQAAELKRLERSDAIAAPWLFATGNVITAPGSHPITTIMRLPADASAERLHQAGVTAVAEGDDVSPIVARKKALGLDGVKIVVESGPPPWHPNPRLSVATAGAILEQARAHGLPVYAHAHSLVEFGEVVGLGVRAVMHGVMDAPIDARLLERMARDGIWYVPTLSVFYGFEHLDRPERLEDEFLTTGVSRRVLRGLEHPLFRFGFGRTLSGYDVSAWLDASVRNLARVHAAGVRVALGTDASTPFNFPGYSAHVEMELMARAGLSTADILRIATVNSAALLGIEDRAGEVAPGRIANLLLLGRNPLEDVRHTRSIERVILKGRVIDPSGV